MNKMIPFIAAIFLATPSFAGLLGVPVGLTQVRSGIWIEAGVSKSEQDAVLNRIGAAQGVMRKSFGKLYALPQWHVCVTERCDKANGIPNRATTYGALLITVSSKAVKDPKTYVHELVHAQMASALPLSIGATSRYPAWFDEGLATVISKSVGYPGANTNCAAEMKKPLPKTAAEFKQLSKPQGAGPIYTRSACAVQAWLGNKPVSAARAQLAQGGKLP
jgi:hypothetical protein